LRRTGFDGRRGRFGEEIRVPTLFRFVVILLVLGGLGFSGMLALAYLVEPEPREMSVAVPPARLQPRR
jgi:hypothetical protein